MVNRSYTYHFFCPRLTDKETVLNVEVQDKGDPWIALWYRSTSNQRRELLQCPTLVRIDGGLVGANEIPLIITAVS
jgi:hypothetical protein